MFHAWPRLLTALFMTFLVLSIPAVHATIMSVSVEGNDGIEGFTRSEDTLTIKAEVSKVGTQTAANIQPYIRIGEKTFDSCSDTSSTSIECLYQDTGFQSTAKFDYSTTVRQVDAAGNVLSSRDARWYVDILPPEVRSLNVIQNGDVATVTIRLVDSAYTGGPATCVGLASLQASVSVGPSSGNAVTKDIRGSGCDQTFVLELPFPTASGDSGTVDLVIADLFGNEFVTSETFTVDTQLPVMSPATLTNGYVDILSYIGQNQEQYVYVGFDVSDDQGLVNQYLNVNGQQYSIACSTVSASASNYEYSCKSQGFTVTGAQLFDGEIVVIDVGGNVVTQNIISDITYDTTAPVVRNVRGGVSGPANASYIGPSVPIIVDIDETESGFYKENVRISVVGAGPVDASSCFEQGSVWTCEFFVPSQYGASVSEVSVGLVSGTDDAGNVFSNTANARYVLDTEDPVIEPARTIFQK